MSNSQAAERIVEIQHELVASVLGAPRTANLFAEQRELWDDFFRGVPYEHIALRAEAV